MSKQQEEKKGLESVNTALTKTERMLERNRVWLLSGAVVIVMLVVGFLLYRSYVVIPNRQEAQEQIYFAEQQFQKDSLDLALNGDGNHLGFLQVIDKYGSTPAGNLACYYAGLIYRDKGEWDNALKMLSAYKRVDKMVAPIAEGAMGDCYVEKGDLSSALKQYEKAVSSKYNGNPMTTPFFLAKLAVLHEHEGRLAEAQKAYERIRQDYPMSQQAREVEKNLARLAVLGAQE